MQQIKAHGFKSKYKYAKAVEEFCLRSKQYTISKAATVNITLKINKF